MRQWRSSKVRLTAGFVADRLRRFGHVRYAHFVLTAANWPETNVFSVVGAASRQEAQSFLRVARAHSIMRSLVRLVVAGALAVAECATSSEVLAVPSLSVAKTTPGDTRCDSCGAGLVRCHAALHRR